MKDPEDREYIQSLERGIGILRAFNAQRPRMTLSEAAVETGLTRATARRFLLTLARLDLVGSDGKQFWLLPSILDLGFRYLSGLPWWQSAQPIIEEISRDLNESCSISIIDGNTIIYVARATVNRILSVNISIGSRFPATSTAMGRSILSGWPDAEIDAYLAKVPLTRHTAKTITDPDQLREALMTCRRKGYSLVDGELEEVLRGLAVPIFDHAGRAIAALGISVHASSETQAALIKRGLPAIQAASARITQSMTSPQF